MENGDVSGKLHDIVRGIAGKRCKGEVGPSTRLVEDLGFDSVMAIRAMLEIQKAFNVDIASQSDKINIADITTVNDLQLLIEKLSGAARVDAG